METTSTQTAHKGLNPEAGWSRTGGARWPPGVSHPARLRLRPHPAPLSAGSAPSLLGPLRRSICIRRRLPAPPSAHVTPGRRREPADLTRAVLRLPLARNSKSSRDLRPRPPAANKSAGRLQTQNFHVGKSQDGRERSGAPTGSLAQRPGAQRAGLRRAGGPWEGGQARQADATPGRSSGALAPRSVGHAHQPGRMGTALCGPVARAQQLLARSVWGGVRDPARWSGLDGLGAPGLCRGLHPDRLRRRCLSGQKETGRVGGWQPRGQGCVDADSRTVRGQLDNRSSVVRLAGGRGGREKPGFPGTSRLRETAP